MTGMSKIAIIGGTGVYHPGILDNVSEQVLENDYGQARVAIGTYEGMEVAFLARHGAGHSVPPHRINYRANIFALHLLGVERIIATAAVGSLNPNMKPGDFVLVDQFLDFTRGRESTFYDGDTHGVIHCDMTVPYCEELRAVLGKVAIGQGIPVHEGGVYVCAEGPRFETAAEIRMYRQLGGDVVGMTSVPECVLARELGICYACIGTVTNYAAGIVPGKLTHSEVVEIVSANTAHTRKLLMDTLALISEARGCGCDDILREIEKLQQMKKG